MSALVFEFLSQPNLTAYKKLGNTEKNSLKIFFRKIITVIPIFGPKIIIFCYKKFTKNFLVFFCMYIYQNCLKIQGKKFL